MTAIGWITRFTVPVEPQLQVSSGGSLIFSASDLSGFRSGPAILRVDNSVDHGYITTTYHFSDRTVTF